MVPGERHASKASKRGCEDIILGRQASLPVSAAKAAELPHFGFAE